MKTKPCNNSPPNRIQVPAARSADARHGLFQHYGVTAILIHGSVDFNLQIPANAMIFVALLALAWISLHLGRRFQADPLTSSGREAKIV